MSVRCLRACCLLTLILAAGCGKPAGSGKPVIGVAFETLQTEFWVAGFGAIKAECQERGYDVVESVADGDANRQLQQVKNLVTRGVTGIILVPKDTKTCGPMIRAANQAGIPMSLFNRPAPEGTADVVSVVADNFTLAKQTTEYLIEQARQRKLVPCKAMLLVGDLGDSNSIARRDGFRAAVDAAAEMGFTIDVVTEVPTEWNQEKAQAGVVNGLQAHPDISLIFTSSDFLLPSIVSALQSAGKYHTAGNDGHVILGGFDGDATAYRLLKEGYLDATGVQDVYFEAEQCLVAIDARLKGKPVEAVIQDPGFVIHRDNMQEKQGQMWGAQVAR